MRRPSTARGMVPVRHWSLAYLTTGVLVSILAQKVASSPDVDPALHVIPAAKWMSTAVVSLVAHVGAVRGRRAQTPVEGRERTTFKIKVFTALLGALDCAAYAMFCLGLASCGAATAGVVLPAMGHVLTAFFSVTLLRNTLSGRRALAVAVVFLGLLVKGWEVRSWEDMEVDAWLGFGYLGLASLCYSSMGVLYENLVRSGSAPRHATITLYSSIIGTLTYFAYLLVYGSDLSLGRRILIREWIQVWGGDRGSERRGQLAQSTLSVASALPVIPTWMPWLGAFAVLYNVHVYVQGMTFRSDGALGVQLVNSVRGCIAYMAFCILSGPPGTWVRSERTGMASGLLAATGGVLWIDSKSRTEKRPASRNTALKEKAT